MIKVVEMNKLSYLALIICCLLLLVREGYAQSGFPYCEPFTHSTTRANTIYGGASRLTSGNADPAGQGVLRLTSNQINQTGYVYVDIPFSSKYGIKTSFEYFSYGRAGAEGADGFSFFLFDAAVPNSEFRIGGNGGSLGYTQKNNTPGLKGAFIGIGFDEFGNFSSKSDGNKTDGPGKSLQSITIRGPETSPSGSYPYVTHKRTTTAHQFSIDHTGNTRPESIDMPGYRSVVINLQPSSDGLYTITVEMQVTTPTVQGAFYTVINQHTFPYIAPENLKVGFSGSTGQSTNFHEIRNLLVEVSDENSLLDPIAKDKISAACAAQENVIEVTVEDVELTNDPLNNSIRCLQLAENLEDFLSDEMDICHPDYQQCDLSRQVLDLDQGTFQADARGGRILFTPSIDFVGETVTIFYTATDNYGKTSEPKAIHITINQKPQPPLIKIQGGHPRHRD